PIQSIAGGRIISELVLGQDGALHSYLVLLQCNGFWVLRDGGLPWLIRKPAKVSVAVAAVGGIFPYPNPRERGKSRDEVTRPSPDLMLRMTSVPIVSFGCPAYRSLCHPRCVPLPPRTCRLPPFRALTRSGRSGQQADML